MQKIHLWTSGLELEPDVLKQLQNLVSLPILAGHLAVMPDVHLGKGATVGSVIPTKGAIIPAAVGVDIGCGMMAVRTSLKASALPDSLSSLRLLIEAAIPVGFHSHKESVRLDAFFSSGAQMNAQRTSLAKRFKNLALQERLGKIDEEKIWNQLGSLGGGNHFIELCLSDEAEVWLMLHSGSRNIGKVIAEVAITWAKELAIKRGLCLPDKDLAWLTEGSFEFHAYLEALLWAQDYAALNRQMMLELLLQILKNYFGDSFQSRESAINCHHNYAQKEKHFGEWIWVTRKGAVSAKKGELGIIPGSMGARSFIVRGKGNLNSYHSCSHGAGRLMSRTEAKKRFNQKDLLKQTQGVECRRDKGIIDEIPAAYKDIEKVIAAQTDLIEVVTVLKQVLCVKG